MHIKLYLRSKLNIADLTTKIPIFWGWKLTANIYSVFHWFLLEFIFQNWNIHCVYIYSWVRLGYLHDMFLWGQMYFKSYLIGSIHIADITMKNSIFCLQGNLLKVIDNKTDRITCSWHQKKQQKKYEFTNSAIHEFKVLENVF